MENKICSGIPYIRRALKLSEVDNFTSEKGQRYTAIISQLATELNQQGFDIKTLSDDELNEVARNVALAAKSKITTSTNFWGKSIVTVDDLGRKTVEIAKTVLQLRSHPVAAKDDIDDEEGFHLPTLSFRRTVEKV